MAARPIISSLMACRTALIASPARALTQRSLVPTRRSISTSKSLFDPTTQQTESAANNPITASMAKSTSPSGQNPDDGQNAAFLGEADSNDGFESWKDAHGPPPPALDATNAAYLGEADSDDGFETHRDAHGPKPDAVDASQAAFLGEADSDDGFEADVEIYPEKHAHRIEDASSSGEHGQPGEGDQ